MAKEDIMLEVLKAKEENNLAVSLEKSNMFNFIIAKLLVMYGGLVKRGQIKQAMVKRKKKRSKKSKESHKIKVRLGDDKQMQVEAKGTMAITNNH
ncbi:unnamed protein product, partial [Dovyalis caffra]